MKNIHIPEPCSENWSKMTPTQKGAFCQKCALEVNDFTNKSTDEIREILTQSYGSRVCGKIGSKQLIQLNDDFLMWKMDNKQSFQRAWIFTLLVVFGMTLFSCEEDEEPVVVKYQKIGQVILAEDAKDKSVEGISEVIETKSTSATRNHSVQAEIVTQEEVQPEIFVEVNDTLEDFLFLEEVIIDGEYAKLGPESIGVMSLGGIGWSEAYVEHLNDTKSPFETDEFKFGGLVYPSPAVNEATLKFTTPNDGNAQIELFAPSGQHVRSIHSGRVERGETEFYMDLTDLETGMYLVILYKDGEKETVKFSKL